MSKMNFNYSNKYKNNKTPKTEESEIKEEVKDEVKTVEEINKETFEENILEVIEDNDVAEEVITSTGETTEELSGESVSAMEEVVEEKYGILQDCELLNVRKEANSNSEILKVFNKNDKIKILDEVGEFYKVLSDNTEAYCMKKFIKLI